MCSFAYGLIVLFSYFIQLMDPSGPKLLFEFFLACECCSYMKSFLFFFFKILFIVSDLYDEPPNDFLFRAVSIGLLLFMSGMLKFTKKSSVSKLASGSAGRVTFISLTLTFFANFFDFLSISYLFLDFLFFFRGL